MKQRTLLLLTGATLLVAGSLAAYLSEFRRWGTAFAALGVYLLIQALRVPGE